MNKVILIGNLAADPETRTTNSGITQCTLRLAVQRRFSGADGKRETDFFTVVCWRQTAEFAARFLSKGRKVAVEGSLQTRSYDAQDGSKRYVTEAIADNVEFCDSKPEGAKQGAVLTQNGGFVELDDDQMDVLPF